MEAGAACAAERHSRSAAAAAADRPLIRTQHSEQRVAVNDEMQDSRPGAGISAPAGFEILQQSAVRDIWGSRVPKPPSPEPSQPASSTAGAAAVEDAASTSSPSQADGHEAPASGDAGGSLDSLLSVDMLPGVVRRRQGGSSSLQRARGFSAAPQRSPPAGTSKSSAGSKQPASAAGASSSKAHASTGTRTAEAFNASRGSPGTQKPATGPAQGNPIAEIADEAAGG